jgi:hypothetical protein
MSGGMVSDVNLKAHLETCFLPKARVEYLM